MLGPAVARVLLMPRAVRVMDAVGSGVLIAVVGMLARFRKVDRGCASVMVDSCPQANGVIDANTGVGCAEATHASARDRGVCPYSSSDAEQNPAKFIGGMLGPAVARVLMTPRVVRLMDGAETGVQIGVLGMATPFRLAACGRVALGVTVDRRAMMRWTLTRE
jgi:hypothetical protein